MCEVAPQHQGTAVTAAKSFTKASQGPTKHRSKREPLIQYGSALQRAGRERLNTTPAGGPLIWHECFDTARGGTRKERNDQVRRSHHRGRCAKAGTRTVPGLRLVRSCTPLRVAIIHLQFLARAISGAFRGGCGSSVPWLERVALTECRPSDRSKRLAGSPLGIQIRV